MIILRTHVFGEHERALMTRLQKVRSHHVVVAMDETRGVVDTAPFDKISVTNQRCEDLGLYCTRDFTWRNGDYAFYLARQQYPQEKFFWMIEPDVEHTFSSDAALFDHFDMGTDVDLLAPYFRSSTKSWWWSQTVRRLPTGAKRALFCFVRVSAQAIDLCLKQRKKERFSPRSRIYWPNDEVFFATEVVHSGLSAADLNDFFPAVYTTETLSFDKPVDGTDGTFRESAAMIYHPVLYGSAYEQRIKRNQRSESSGNRKKFIQRKLQRIFSLLSL